MPPFSLACQLLRTRVAPTQRASPAMQPDMVTRLNAEHGAPDAEAHLVARGVSLEEMMAAL